MIDTLLPPTPTEKLVKLVVNEPPPKEGKKRQPVEDTGPTMKYLGVEVKKSVGDVSDKIPLRSAYEDIVDTKQAAETKRAIAISILMGVPLYLQGKTSNGKSLLPLQMAADLNRRVYTIDGHGFTSAVDIIGAPGEPETVFQEALRREDGVEKILIINEVNAILPDALKAMNRAFDEYSREPNHSDRAIILTANPASEGTRGVVPLSEDLMRRLSVHRVPDKLSDPDFEFFVLSRIDEIEKGEVAPEITEESFLNSREKALSIKELKKQIPGFVDAIKKYIAFHTKVKHMIDNNDIDKATHGEAVVYADYVEPDRILDFMGLFCPKDPEKVIPTLQHALRFFYSNKLDGESREIIEDEIDAIGGVSKEKKSMEEHISEDYE